jgi:hypothetical protein
VDVFLHLVIQQIGKFPLLFRDFVLTWVTSWQSVAFGLEIHLSLTFSFTLLALGVN